MPTNFTGVNSAGEPLAAGAADAYRQCLIDCLN
jgi:hypothetical protein